MKTGHGRGHTQATKHPLGWWWGLLALLQGSGKSPSPRNTCCSVWPLKGSLPGERPEGPDVRHMLSSYGSVLFNVNNKRAFETHVLELSAPTEEYRAF